MSTQTTAIILAAGKGTRMKSALPKVMHAVAGQPMIAHVTQLALAVDAVPICLVLAEGMERVAAVGREVAGDIDVAIQKEALGTAHAVLAARPVLGDLDGNALILYGDTPLLRPETVRELLAALNEDKQCAVAVLGFMPEDAGSYGRLVLDDEGDLERIVEAKDATEEELEIPLCNSGVMAVRGSLLWKLLAQVKNDNAKGEYYLTDIIALARASGFRAAAIEGDESEVLGVNSRRELAEAESIFQYRMRQQFMDAGVTLIDPDSVFFAADTQIANDVVIEPNVVFGRGVRIARGARINAFSHIEGATIGEDASVGPFARIRPGTELGAQVKLGNFVEIKKSTLGKGAKVSHLSYIGDSEIGAEANIGAGTITCNYDGYTKAKTTIGAGAFIGSNTALIAPVTVGAGAMVGAGSVITTHVPADALALTRPARETREGWAADFRVKQKKNG